jgi:hypothetical protein
MKIKGVASTIDVDSDQEILEPSGFILDKFLSTGFLNYNHKSSTDPTSIVGEPTKAYVDKNGLLVEGFLYPDSKKAVDLWDTIKTVRNNSSNRRIGMSIEGKALERDPLNPKRITKALITGCAITPTPKNAHTLVEVMKGEVDYEDYEYEVIKADQSANGGNIEYIIDVIDEKGFRRTVDKDFNISIKKMDLAAYGATADSYGVTAESLAGTKRKGKAALKNVVKEDFFEKKQRNFSKSEVYHKIFTIFTPDINKAKIIYGLLERIEGLKNNDEMSLNEGEISQETIDKAEQLFKLTAEDVNDKDKGSGSLNKSDDNDEDDEEKMKKALDEAKIKVKELEMKIGARAGLKDENQMGNPDEDGGAVSVQKSEEGDASKATEDVINKSEGAEDLSKTKDAKPEEINKAETADIIKSHFNELSDNLIKSVSDKLQAVGELYLTQNDAQADTDVKLEVFSKSLEEIKESLEVIAAQPVTGRRGIISKASVERFQEEHGEDAKVLSLSANRTQIVNFLYEKSNLEKGEDVDNQMVKAMQEMEIVGQMSDPTIQNRLKKEYNIHLVN